MSKNPLINALFATAYIALVASLLYYGSRTLEPVDGVIVPIAMLSLFVLSAAVMGYLFLYQPLRFLLDGEKEIAAKLFLSTLATFGLVTGTVFILLFLLPTVL